MRNIDTKMILAWAILTAISILLFAATAKTSPYAAAEIAVLSIVTAIIYPAIVIVLLNKLATDNGVLKENKLISVWGYLWRTIVIQYASLFMAGVSTAIIIGKGPYITIPDFMFLFALHVISSILVCWVIFSRDRKKQLEWVLSMVRGY